MTQSVSRFASQVLSVIVPVLLTACAGQRISTSVQDQTFVPAPAPVAKVEPAPVPPSEPEPRVAEAPAPTTSAPEPAPPAPVEEARVTEPPIAPPAPVQEKPAEVLAPPAPPVAPPAAEPQPAPAPPPAPEPSPPPPPPAPIEEARVTEPAPPPPAPAPPPALSDVFFDYDRAAIRNEAQAILEADARLIQAANGRKVLIEGHCDERGTLEYNLVLGERRAQAVQRYLQDLGVASSQIQIVSYGKEKPFCTEHSEACWQQNRRAHFVLQ